MTVNDLTKLYNTLMTIEVKGTNVLVMADCLQFLAKGIAEEQAKAATAEKEDIQHE